MTPPPSDDSILWEEVTDAVRRLKRNKSPGNDGITAEMIKQVEKNYWERFTRYVTRHG